MILHNFQYDGINLRDMGFMVCSFDRNGLKTVDNGTEIKFNTIPVRGGDKFEITSASYSEGLSAKMQICKIPCGTDDISISMQEFLDMTSWLCRKGFHKFKVMTDDYADIYFEGTFNIRRIEFDDKLIGLELELTTNRPYGVLENVKHYFDNTSGNKIFKIIDLSNTEGYMYPKIEIEILLDGDITITNSDDGRVCRIKNCIAGEIITMSYPIITSSLEAHKLQDDFNWIFPRINNRYRDKKNEYTIDLPCKVNIIYSPIIKIGI